MSQKSKIIRDLFKLSLGPLSSAREEFATEHMKEQWAPLEEMMRQMANTLMVQEIQKGIESGELTVVDAAEDEFIDVSRPAMDRYHKLCERFGQQGPSKILQRDLEKLIQQDPDFLDSYAMLSGLLREQGREREADQLIEEAYQRALRLITDDDGDWTALLEWSWLENRHIIRALLSKAVLLWKSNESEAALDLSRKLLRANPPDNPGVRNYILAIRLGISFDDFESRFNKDGFYDMDLFDWFERNFERFPDEFGWWKEAVEGVE
jgi:tetratricopeptide (TPR) repeat protein